MKLHPSGTLQVYGFTLAVLILGLLTAGAGTSKYSAGNTKNTPLDEFYPTPYNPQRYTYFDQLPAFDPRTPMELNEMRITFMGSTFPMTHRAQAEMSLFVEVGRNPTNENLALDQFIFDLGCGVSANYTSLGIDFARMNKIFVNHLHADHISDLIQVYSFGNGGTRKFPLYVWGSADSGVPNPGNGPAVTNNLPQQVYNPYPPVYSDGIVHLCKHLREALRWQTESQAFQSSAYPDYPMPEQIKEMWGLPVLPLPAGDDPPRDANALIPIPLDWWKNGVGPDGQPNGDNVAYNNQDSRAKVSHYPVIHCRKGAMGYRLEWTPPDSTKPLTMVYSSDTRPETNSIEQAKNWGKGVDVFIHEMILAPEALTLKSAGYTQPLTNYPGYSTPYWTNFWANAVNMAAQVEDSSHTPQGAFGHLLSKISPRPRLAVATHFPVSDDTVACALRSVQAHCQDIEKVGDQLVWSTDLMVLRVFPDKIIQCRAVPNDFAFAAPPSVSYSGTQMFVPKYHTQGGDWDPVVQLDRSAEIPPTNPDGTTNYRTDGY